MDINARHLALVTCSEGQAEASTPLVMLSCWLYVGKAKPSAVLTVVLTCMLQKVHVVLTKVIAHFIVVALDPLWLLIT